MSSDGPSKLAPKEAEQLDDIILGDDESLSVPPPGQSKAPLGMTRSKAPERGSTPAPPVTVGQVALADSKDAQARKRAKLTLRIPDDEISRPNLPATTPSGGVMVVPLPPEEAVSPPARPASAPPARFHADDTVELPSDVLRARLAALTGDGVAKPAVAVGVDATHEAGWTPYQPEVSGEIEPSVPTSRHGGGPTLVDAQSLGDILAPSRETPSTPPISEEIPVEMDFSVVPDTSSDELATYPHLPTPLDSEEIRIDESDRVSETGEVEVEAEDLVSVESLPSQQLPPPPVKSGGKVASVRGADGAGNSVPSPAVVAPHATASSLMSGVTPTSVRSSPGPTTSIAPSVSPSTPPSAPHTPSSQVGAASSPTSAPSSAPLAAGVAGPAARRATPNPSTPLVFVPPVGALAPPPMTDAAASRKKTRPWWEELFNDDFIRTMAKVTDPQIVKEVNFIEESLGCEAGAMILDLACGTGRHAVELATRGYQVVGFDLSLSMLARASDEAQERKQKINFVQGDMREMTFEETFDGIYSWNTSFGYFDEEKNGAVIARVHKALKKGGQFLLDVVNRDYIVRQAPSLAWFEGDGCICMDEMTIDFITSRMKVKRTLMMDDGRTKEIEYSVRVYALHELGKMLHDNGFRVAEVSGRTGTPGVFFGCEAPRTLILAEKR